MHTVILGNGVAGVSAALELRRLDPARRITILSGESTYHYSRPALMYVFMGHMRYQDTKPFQDSLWRERRLELVRAWVRRVDTQAKRLELAEGETIEYDQLLIATGSRPNSFGWPGQDLRGVQGLWGLQDLRALYENVQHTREAIVVGGGLIGIELAEMLHSVGVEVTLMIRESSYWSNILPAEESELVNREIARHGLRMLRETELDEVLDDGTGRCRGVRTKDGRELECQLVGLTVGVSPNLAALEGSGIETGRGVLVDDALRTSAEDVFAAGDCAEIARPEGERNVLQQVWYTGKMQGEHAARAMAGLDPAPYDSGIWFNSAKFLDLEYHTYGLVKRDLPGEESLYWEHASGQHALRIVHQAGEVVGFNSMGLRLRHEVCESWLRERARLETVLPRLEEAHFDPELFRRHEDEIRASFQGVAL